MRFMVLLRADKDSEAGVMPSLELLKAMGDYNEALVKAGVMVDGAGLQATSKGARVIFNGSDRKVVEGPFPVSDNLLAGYWMFDVKSKEEAIEWIKKAPNPMLGESVIEIRQVFESEDFADIAPEEVEREKRMMEEVARQRGK